MLKEKLSEIKFNLVEAISFLSFIALGYCLIYKYSFYQSLGVPWLITSLTPQFIFLTSLKLLFISLISIIFGFTYSYAFIRISKYFPQLDIKIILPINVVILLVFVFLYTKLEKILPQFYLSFKTYDIYYSYFIIVMTIFLSLTNYQYTEIQKDLLITPSDSLLGVDFKLLINKFYFSVIILFIIFFTYFLQPFTLGSKDAKLIIENKNKLLNKIILKNNTKEWFLIEYMGEKMLIIDNDSNIKIIKYEDVDLIKRIKLDD